MKKNGKIQEVGIAQVSLTEPYLTNALELEIEYLTSFDPDRWLAGFRENAGLDMKGKQRYGGWEDSLIAGHAFGHYLGACAYSCASPDVSEADKDKLYKDICYIVEELKVCQENSKGKPGFLFCANIIDKNNVEKQFDNVEEGKVNIITEAWVPWYTMHKLIQGLVDVYNFTGNETALEVAEGLGNWTSDRVAGWSSELNTKVLSIEYGGMNDCLYELYAITGNERYAVAAHKFDEEPLFEKVLSGAENALTNRHANTTIPKFIGALKRYYYMNGEVDATRYLEYAKAFFEMVRDRHTYITGGNSEWEHFGEDGILDKERTNCNNETCNIHNMLKLSRLLFMISGERQYADFYENAYINSILSSQNPETGMTMYFQPMSTGYFKVYGERYNKFWCCTGTGMENFTKLGDSIYFEDENGVYINMYFGSIMKSKLHELTLVQKSKMLEFGGTEFTIISGDRLDCNLYFRIPDWAEAELCITVNGKMWQHKKEGGYAILSGPFTNNDKIGLTIPMKMKAYPLEDNKTSIGFKYGPLVLSAALGNKDMKLTTTGMNVSIPMSKLVDNEYIVLGEGKSRDDLLNDADYFFERVSNTEFKLKNSELIFSPHYAQYKQRYGIYWYFVSRNEYDQVHKKPSQSEDTIIDTVQPGYGQYENDRLHMLKEKNSVSITNDGTYRYAKSGGFFTYNFAVSKNQKNYLSLTLRKSDNGKSLNITSNNEVLFSETLDYIGLEENYELRVEIPGNITDKAISWKANGESYDIIPVTFSGINNEESAKVCDFIYTLTEKRLYEVDETLAYFVNCGAHNPYIPAEGERFGVYNSLMEQLYGYDKVTGKKWGLIDDPTDRYKGSRISKALYTANTWAYEINTDEDLAKEDTCRYTKNQYENGVAVRYIDYAFQLPNGEYKVEIGFSNPWGCSDRHNVYANIGKDNEQLLAEEHLVTGTPLVGKVNVNDGLLTLNFRNGTSSGHAINITYIKIFFEE